MNRRTNPAMVGLFVVMALAIAVTAIIVLGTHRLGRPVTPAVLYFKDSVAGLDPGAPVEWSGVSIGQVEDIRMVYDANRNDLRIPVRVALERDRIAGLRARDPDAFVNKLRLDIATGLRARLEMQSLITGKLKVVLLSQPDAPHAVATEENGVIVIPTVSSPFDAFTQQLGNLPLERIVATLDDSLRTLSRLLVGLESGGAVSNLNATLASTRQISAELERARVGDLVSQAHMLVANATGLVATGGVREAFSNANALLTASQDVLLDLRQQADGLRGDLGQTARETADAARAVRVLADYLEQHPEALLRGKRGE